MTSRRNLLKGIGSGAALITVGGVGLASADDDTDDQGDGKTAEVRVGHLSPDAPTVYVEVDGERATPDFSYPEFVPNSSGSYLDLEAGTYDITTRLANNNNKVDALSVEDFELEANTDYTILATGELEPEADTEQGLGLLPLVDNGDDDTALPPADATLVRLVHASPDAGTVDLVVNDDDGNEVTTIPDVSFGDATSYLELPPGEYTVDVGPGALAVDVTLEAGTKVSGYVVGNASTEEENDAELGAVTTLDATNPGGGNRNDQGDGDEDEGRDDEDEDEEREDEDEDDEREDEDEEREEEDEDEEREDED